METTKPLQADPSARESERADQEEKKTRKTRRITSPPRNGDGSRFFLADGDSRKEGSPMMLGEEFPNEDAVMVAAFQKDITFYRLETWKARAERKGRQIVLRKQS